MPANTSTTFPFYSFMICLLCFWECSHAHAHAAAAARTASTTMELANTFLKHKYCTSISAHASALEKLGHQGMHHAKERII
jgi:hypothetical protein